MVEKTTKLESPIDVMALMHKAYRAQSDRTEQLAAQLESGGDLNRFTKAFQFWMKQLLYHATAEDKYLTPPLTDCQPARDNEVEHAQLAKAGGELAGFLEKGDAAGLAENLSAAMLALEGEQHRDLEDKLHEVERVLRSALGEDKVAARTRRHLYRRIIDLRILEFDHFENEEAFVVSLVRQRMTEQQQLAVVKRLLIEENAEHPRWIIDWVASELNTGERRLLADLEYRFSEAPIPAT